MSVVEGKVCKTPLQLVLVTNVNTFLTIRCSAILPVSEEIQRGIRRWTLAGVAANCATEVAG